MLSFDIRSLVPQATWVLRDILAPRRGAVLPPIRAEIFGSQRFAQHGHSLAQTHRAAPATLRTATFFPRIKSNIRTLREAHQYIGIQASTGYDISPAAEWLLDNFHLIEAQLKEIHEGLPRSYFRSLPMLVDEPLAGLPRVYGVAWAFVAHTDGAFDEELLVHYLQAYQEVRALSLSEMWALPTTLRVVLVENLRRLAERVATNKAAREVANLCFDRIDTLNLQSLQALLDTLNQRGVGRVFLAQMAQRAQDRHALSAQDTKVYYRDWLRSALPDLASVQTQIIADQAADNLSVSNAVNSLRIIGDADWTDIIGRTSVLMQRMLTFEVFASEDTATRDHTLHALESLAKRSGLSEVAVAELLLERMNTPHANADAAVPSYWLQGAGRADLLQAIGLRERFSAVCYAAMRRAALPLYLFFLVALLGLLLWVLFGWHRVPGTTPWSSWSTLLCLALMLFPASETVVAVINRLISESVNPQHLPRMAMASGIPPEHRVMVVIPGMLTSATAVHELTHRLELHYLANPEPHAQFALLTDWCDADTQQLPSDAGHLANALQRITQLNALYRQEGPYTELAPRFLLLHRGRLFSESEQRWIGWERKRGKLEQLVAALATGTPGAFIDLGEASRMAIDTPYIVTLDSDTQLPPGRLRELVGVAAHPSNQPHVDPQAQRVVRGYGILQPRIATPLPAAKDFTLYHWLFAGQCGIDPYSVASSEVYQDAFSEGTFTGKGLLNVQAVHAVLCGRLPEGQILSHDLLEGAIARCATVTDIAVVEDAPFHADVAASRMHRWTRGDWQLLPWLLQASPSRLPGIQRWKMLDNLRRSLVAPTSTAFLLLALTTGSVSPWSALALVMAAFMAGPLLGTVAGFVPNRNDIAKHHFFHEAVLDLVRVLWVGLWHLAMLLQHALLALDAIGRALYRSFVSHRRLLQWTTAAAAQAQAKSRLSEVARQHRSVSGVALLLLVAVGVTGTPNPVLATVLCLLWAGAPVWTWWVSTTRPAKHQQPLQVPQMAYLEGIARDTWRLFERTVVAQDNHLPPDNLQCTPYDLVAHRTSPTNIGLYLLSVACARQFGWIGTTELLQRLESTCTSMETLQRYRGHFLNWYDTQARVPLLPTYVSTVDSGNLCGHLLAVAQACLELADTPHDPLPSQHAMAALRTRLEPLCGARSTLTPALRETLKNLLADHRATRRSAQLDAQHLDATTPARLQAMAQRLQAMAWEMDFSFLYHRKRHLFHIGFRVAEQQRDAGFYDLLASESRLTSLLSIAKGDVPVRHWAALGRPFFAVGIAVGLRSWSGSMFEYLMPSLVLQEPGSSVLGEACTAALHEQIIYAQAQDMPWGISESAYAASDHTLAYQYAPQGVPRLALRRTPAEELVVAPYATALATQLSPQHAVANFQTLQALGARGRYGFIDALDFTLSRRTGDEAFIPVDTFMAHHQGMSIVALANCLLDGPAQRWGMANAHMQAVASLLHERVPREVSVLHTPPTAPPVRLRQRRRTAGLLREVWPGAHAVEPTHLLSNGHYSVSLRANGAGWSHLGGVGITRQRDDALRDDRGSFFYLRRIHGQGAPDLQQPVSITQHPSADPNASYRCTFHADRVCFDTTWSDLQTHTTVWVSPEDDIEFRQVELRNLSDKELDIEVISAFDVTLTEPRADEAHPAFTNLFVQAHWLASHQALLFGRKPRLPTEQGLHLAHFLADSVPKVHSIRLQTNRQRWLGRNHTVAQPLADLEPVPDGPAESPQALDTGLDPVCAMAVRVRVAPHAKLQLTFATAAAQQPDAVQAVIDKYRQHIHVKRASLMSATLTGIRLRALRINAGNFVAMQSLSTALLLSLTRPAPQADTTTGVVTTVCDKRLLWRMGISGDRPIVLVLAGTTQGLGLLRSMAQVLNLWAWASVGCDLVVVNAEPASYQMPLQLELGLLRERHAQDSATRMQPGATGFFVLRDNDLSKDELDTLHALARVVLHADGRPLTHHVQEWAELHSQAQDDRQNSSVATIATNLAARSVLPAPVGQFAAQGEFTFEVGDRARPTRPWINVLANAAFGTHVSEAAGGYTWAINSRMNPLTAWSNDPVSDPPSEWFLLQDRTTLKTWSLAPNAWAAPRAKFRVVHGQGYTTISHDHGALGIGVTWCVDPQASVKQITVALTNHGEQTQRLRLFGLVEWMMGATRSERMTVHTALYRQRLPLQKLTALLCIQPEASGGFGNGTAFFGMAGDAQASEDWTCDRREFFDARGGLVLPDHLGQRSGAGLDPCAALCTDVNLPAGGSVTRVFVLGYAPSADAAQQLAAVAAYTPPLQRLEQACGLWDRLLGSVIVKTPDSLFDAMVNRWLLYQTVVCRLWAKSGFYQAGGATGFRDQLQDSMALAWAAPDMLRSQIVLCASRQFEAGDVQHWWHAPGGAGVRTHFSDDLLWLPYACLHYLRTTGDTTVLDQRVAFLEGASIPEGAEDAYYTPVTSAQEATVYEHAARTLDRSLRVGAHGLPLMGSGDWNDGMNRVGNEGRGESVWLGWFLCQLVADFEPLARGRGDGARADLWSQAAQGWKTALLGPAWDGQWFRRAFFDGGEILGSQANPEARIDLIAQTWSVLSGVAPPGMQHMAMAAVEAHLVNPSAGLVQLLSPPLVNALPSAGYIQAYPPGIRENGGQYCHAGVWALMAAAQLSHTTTDHDTWADTAYRYFTYLSPAHRAADPSYGPAYGIEPYVMAGDVYSQAPYVGQGGWSWYTGAAAWMHRAAIEALFGLRQRAGELSFQPCLPSPWHRAELTLTRDGHTMHFILVRANAVAAVQETASLAAQLLPVGQPLAWNDLPPRSCFVVPLCPQ